MPGCASGASTRPALLSLVFLACSLLAARPSAGQAFLPATMMEAIDSAGILNAFKALAIDAGFGEVFLSPDFAGTVFAPNDMAFAAAGYAVPPPPPPPVDPIEAQDGPAEAAAAPVAAPAAAPAAAPPPPPAAAPAALVPGPGSGNSTVKTIISFHIVHKLKAFPIGSIRQGTALMTQEGHNVYIDRSTPGIVHLYGSVPTRNPTNFGTILQYQEVRGGKAVLYLIDKVLKPPKS